VPKDPDIHVLFPGIAPDAPVLDVATITNFKGAVAAAEIDGGAHGSDGTSYQFDADMRVMQGTYIDTNRSLKKGTFGFI
jgi:hypothetical protein